MMDHETAHSIEHLTADRCPVCKSRDTASLDYEDDTDSAECNACGHVGMVYTFWPSLEDMHVPKDYCGACGRRRSFGCGHQPYQEIELMRYRAIASGAVDPVTFEPFTSAQRQYWIESGKVIDIEETHAS